MTLLTRHNLSEEYCRHDIILVTEPLFFFFFGETYELSFYAEFMQMIIIIYA